MDELPEYLQEHSEPPLEKEESDFTDRYNTPLNEKEESDFTEWAKKEDRLSDLKSYDMRGAYKAGIRPTRESKEHFPDTFKKPNHPTFSDDSIYSGKDGYKGGHWSENKDRKNWTFQPSQTNLDFAGGSAKFGELFKKEAPNDLLLPVSHVPSQEKQPEVFFPKQTPRQAKRKQYQEQQHSKRELYQKRHLLGLPGRGPDPLVQTKPQQGPPLQPIGGQGNQQEIFNMLKDILTIVKENKEAIAKIGFG